MKIAVFHESPPGGAKRTVYELGKGFKKNHSADLFTTGPNFPHEFQDGFNKIYHYEFVPKVWDGGDPIGRIYKDSIELAKLYFLHKKIARDILRKGYDILFVHASCYIEAPFLLRFQSTVKVFYLHDPYYRIIYDSLLSIPKNPDLSRL